MALDRDPAASSRRIVTRAALLVVPLLLAAAGTPWLFGLGRGGPAREVPRERPPTAEELAESRAADERLAREERRWEHAAHLTPAAATRDASGEVTRRFEGFGISVESEPSGARVIADGEELGDTPLVASIGCAPGATVRVRIEKPPLAPAVRTTTCRDGTLVELSARLERR